MSNTTIARLIEGSPPHLRGKLEFKRKSQNRTRITPAPAGKTAVYGQGTTGFKDHPRTCGENDLPFSHIDYLQGSPPHLRGKPRAGYRKVFHIRITPAPAGKTLKSRVDTLCFL